MGKIELKINPNIHKIKEPPKNKPNVLFITKEKLKIWFSL